MRGPPRVCVMEETTGLAALSSVLCSGWREHRSLAVVFRTGGICILRLLILWHEANSKRDCSSLVIWERWCDLFTCNEAWPCFSRDFLKRGMCQLTDLSPWMKPQANFLFSPSSLPPSHFFSDHLCLMFPLPDPLQVAYLWVNSETSNYKGHPDNWPVFQGICTPVLLPDSFLMNTSSDSGVLEPFRVREKMSFAAL